MQVRPKWRNGVGMAAILLLILVWSIAAVSLAPAAAAWPWPIEAAFYLAAGLAWIIPVKPLLTWMETGAWRRG